MPNRYQVRGFIIGFLFVLLVSIIAVYIDRTAAQVSGGGTLAGDVVPVAGRGSNAGQIVRFTYTPVALGNTVIVHRVPGGIGAPIVVAIGTASSNPEVFTAPSAPGDSAYFYYFGDTYYALELVKVGDTTVTVRSNTMEPTLPASMARDRWLPLVFK